MAGKGNEQETGSEGKGTGKETEKERKGKKRRRLKEKCVHKKVSRALKGVQARPLDALERDEGPKKEH